MHKTATKRLKRHTRLEVKMESPKKTKTDKKLSHAANEVKGQSHTLTKEMCRNFQQNVV